MWVEIMRLDPITRDFLFALMTSMESDSMARFREARGVQGLGDMYLIQDVRQVIACRVTLEPVGGNTASIFRETEDYLLESSDHQCALEYIARRKNMDRYHSMVDFLFCELFPSMQKGCFAFYEDRGPQLRYLIDEPVIEVVDMYLLLALHAATYMATHQEEFGGPGHITWKFFEEYAELLWEQTTGRPGFADRIATWAYTPE
jgi:hypothetical protein